MKGPRGELWAKIIKRKNTTKTNTIGIAHHILFFHKNTKRREAARKRNVILFHKVCKNCILRCLRLMSTKLEYLMLAYKNREYKNKKQA